MSIYQVLTARFQGYHPQPWLQVKAGIAVPGLYIRPYSDAVTILAYITSLPLTPESLVLIEDIPSPDLARQLLQALPPPLRSVARSLELGGAVLLVIDNFRPAASASTALSASSIPDVFSLPSSTVSAQPVPSDVIGLPQTHPKALVIYTYHESTAAAQNLDFFSRFGMYNSHCYYLLVVNGPELSIPVSPRWQQVLHRENAGLDFGGWYTGLGAVAARLPEFEHFVFLNDTVRGPFGDRHWITTLTSLLTPEVKLAGITINGCRICVNAEWDQAALCRFHDQESVAHVQSMLLVTDRVGLAVIYPGVIDGRNLDKIGTVVEKEIGASVAIRKAGYRIGCLIPGLAAGHYGDPWAAGSGFRPLHPLEVIFYKSNRASWVGGEAVLAQATGWQNSIGSYY